MSFLGSGEKEQLFWGSERDVLGSERGVIETYVLD
jgi:hypothetical protein